MHYLPMAGFGMKAIANGIEYDTGNDKLVTQAYLLREHVYFGHLIIGDTIKADSRIRQRRAGSSAGSRYGRSLHRTAFAG